MFDDNYNSSPSGNYNDYRDYSRNDYHDNSYNNNNYSDNCDYR